MSDKFVECCSHGKATPAFVCQHFLTGEKVGWNEPDEYEYNEDDEFAGCINAWCDECEEFVNKIGEWNEESETFANIRLVCENCALNFKEANLK
jgi:hypothetical protein